MDGDRYDIVIGGGGFVGLALALSLAKSAPGSFRVAIVERAPIEPRAEAAGDVRAVALIAASRALLEALDVWPELAADAQPVTGIDITDSALETPLRTVLLQFEPGPDGAPTASIVENARLRAALLAAVERLGAARLIAPQSVAGLDVSASGATVSLKSGRKLTASLVVASDGQSSELRRMAGIKALRWPSEQVAITGTITHQTPHGGRAVQHFLPSGPFALLPMTGNRCSIVWTEQAEKARRVLALDESGLVGEIETRAGARLGSISLGGRLAAYPLTTTLARDFVAPRLALAGDAAHALHWIAGQGLNHGLKDAAALAEVLVDAARLGLDIGDVDVLRRYERWRRFDSATSAASGAALNLLFSAGGTPGRMMRQFGLGLVERSPRAKGLFMREAAGLTGTLPKLLQGRLA
jgi:2-octaprenyl-6-methoxyphenol hydroxylase